MTRSGDELTQPAAGESALLWGQGALGSRIGRYVIRERLGHGGMGVVFAAWDPELDREVAIKVLYPSRARVRSRRDALRREAQALARLNHPNVVTILHVDEDDGQIYVVMERLRGATLDVWSKEPRSTAAILDVLRQAGRGLAAAHAAGLVHRDFKPANIMVSPDESRRDAVGRVRVMDFGLARAARALPTENASSLPDAVGDDQSGSHLAGTPAYMAPEQFEDAEPDPRSDQYAFCVTAYEALMGRRPYSGQSAVELAIDFERTRPAPLVRAGLSSRAARAIERGLDPDPARRWPSLEPLLQRLAPDRPTRRWVPGLGIAAAGLAGAWWWSSAATPDVCARGHPATQTWAEDRERIVESFAASQRPYARELADAATARLGDWVDRWSELDGALCRRTIDAREPVEEQRACLDAAIGRWSALVQVLARADAAAMHRALNAIDELPALERCTDAQWLGRGGWHVAEDAADAEIRVELDLADAEFDTGDYAGARARLAALRERVAASGGDRWLARIDLLDGDIDRTKGEFARASELLERSHFAALAAGDEHTALQAAFLLIEIEGDALSDYDAARRWSEHADSLAKRIDDALLWAQLDQYRATVANRAGDYANAVEIASRGLARIEMIEAPEATRADLHSAIGAALARLERFPEATEHFQQAHESNVRLSGENHPDTSFSGHNVANILAEQERFAEAIPMYERVLAVREAAFGPENPRVADVLANMAAAYGDMGEYDESVTYARRAIAIHERATGVDHAKSLAARATLGVALMQLGRLDEARGVLEAVLSGQEAVHGEHHAQVVDALVNLASIDLAADAPLPAIERLERARAIFLGLENRPPSLGPVIAYLRARAFAGVGRCDEAQSALDENATRPRRPKGPCDDVDVARQHCPALPVPPWCTGE